MDPSDLSGSTLVPVSAYSIKLNNMKKSSLIPVLVFSLLMMVRCAEKKSPDAGGAMSTMAAAPEKPKFGGYESEVKWGEHLVTVGGCNDCHTPKKMGPHGPELDMSLMLSGHPAGNPKIDVDRKAMEKKGLVVTNDLTEWVGPWGVSYTANLTPDATGTLNWTIDNFMLALREGKAKGLSASRTLLPPMPWNEATKFYTDDEIKAIFAYTRVIPAISNNVPAPLPPASAPAPK